jgi:lipid-binding SYLF domain-containing protein/peptidoglycan hydrolase-like protein with peptidoglycan-binding domain
MSVNKLGVILFSSFLIFATAPLAPAQSTQNQNQDEKKQAKKGTTKKETGKTTEKNATENKAGTADKTGTEKSGKTGAKKAKKTSSMSTEKVREVQTALKGQGFDPGPIDGIMGPMTMTALRNFQSHNHLQVTGNLDTDTENKLLHGASASAQRSSIDQNQEQSTPEQSTQQQSTQNQNQPQQQALNQNQPQPSLEEPIGVNNEPAVSSVDDVKQIQQKLADLMYNPGEANGIMTSQTQQSIREFQYLNGLPVTGMVDDSTKIALDTQWRGGIENAQLGQTPFAEREKPSPTIEELEQNQNQNANQNTNRTDTYNQNRTGTYNRDQSTSSSTTTDNTYNKQDKSDYNKQDKSDYNKQDKSDHSGKQHDSAKMDKDVSDRIQKAAAALHDLTTSADKRIPNDLLDRSEAIAVIPHMVKGAFGIGGRYGKGVVSQRMASGRWSAPAFIEIGGGSFGAQIGVEATDLVLVFTDRKALDTLENGKDLKLGVDAGIAAGPLGRGGELGTNAKLESSIYAYSRSKGLFAGVALDGAVLNMNKDMNTKVYGAADAKQVLDGKVAANAEVRPFVDELEKVSPKKQKHTE